MSLSRGFSPAIYGPSGCGGLKIQRPGFRMISTAGWLQLGLGKHYVPKTPGGPVVQILCAPPSSPLARAQCGESAESARLRASSEQAPAMAQSSSQTILCNETVGVGDNLGPGRYRAPTR